MQSIVHMLEPADTSRQAGMALHRADSDAQCEDSMQGGKNKIAAGVLLLVPEGPGCSLLFRCDHSRMVARATMRQSGCGIKDSCLQTPS